MSWRNFQPELLVLFLNLVCVGFYLPRWRTEPGKLLYWVGASILMMGLYKMKG